MWTLKQEQTAKGCGTVPVLSLDVTEMSYFSLKFVRLQSSIGVLAGRIT